MNNFKGIIDTTLRDGQQSPLMFDARKYRFSVEEKKTLTEGLIKLGVRNFEFFAPVVSQAERQDFDELKTYMRSLSGNTVRLLAHCRCHPTDVEQAIAAGFDGLNFYIGVANHAQQNSHGYHFKEIIKLVTETIQSTRQRYPNLYLRFSVEDCFRTPLADVYKVYDQVAPYVQTFGMPDTVGIATPDVVHTRIKALRRRYPKVDLECHFHNDRGFSLINALTAVQAGATYVDTSIWGMAERSGITSVTGLLFNLHKTNPEYCRDYQLQLCYPLNVLMASILRLLVPYDEPVSLTNRTHTAGVHQKAVLKDKIVYEAHDLHEFGVNKNQLLLGPLSGWNLIYYYLREVENYDISPDEARKVTSLFKQRVTEMNHHYAPETLLHEVAANYQLRQFTTTTEFGERLENLS